MQNIRYRFRFQFGHGPIDGSTVPRLGKTVTKRLHRRIFAVPALFHHGLDIVQAVFDFLGLESERRQLVIVHKGPHKDIDQPDGDDTLRDVGPHIGIIAAVQALPDELLGPSAVRIARNGPSQGTQSILRHIEHACFDRARNGTGNTETAALPVSLVHFFFFTELLQVPGDRPFIFQNPFEQIRFLVLFKDFVDEVILAYDIDAVIDQCFHRRIEGGIAGVKDKGGQILHQLGRFRISL